jgi:hypothetical protein
MRLRFTIRDLLWVMLVVGVMAGYVNVAAKQSGRLGISPLLWCLATWLAIILWVGPRLR